LVMLKGCAAEVQDEKETDQLTKDRIQNMLNFVESTSNWYEQISEIPTGTLTKLMSLGTKITKLVKN
jgi:DNA-binding transcriptional regulator GbsR (MarR family)